MNITVTGMLNNPIDQHQSKLTKINQFLEKIKDNNREVYIVDDFIFKPTKNFFIQKYLKNNTGVGFIAELPTIMSTMSSHMIVLSTKPVKNSICIKIKKSIFKEISSEKFWQQQEKTSYDDKLHFEKRLNAEIPKNILSLMLILISYEAKNKMKIQTF